jgi:hypothetical protein
MNLFAPAIRRRIIPFRMMRAQMLRVVPVPTHPTHLRFHSHTHRFPMQTRAKKHQSEAPSRQRRLIAIRASFTARLREDLFSNDRIRNSQNWPTMQHFISPRFAPTALGYSSRLKPVTCSRRSSPLYSARTEQRPRSRNISPRRTATLSPTQPVRYLTSPSSDRK